MSMTPERKQRIKRTRAAIHGTAEIPRLTVERTAKHFRAQLINDSLGTSIAAASDHALSGLTGVKQAEAVGTKLAQAAAKAGITRAILDRRGYRYHGRVKAFAEAARTAGLTI